jgi:hypothetical protein
MESRRARAVWEEGGGTKRKKAKETEEITEIQEQAE